ncbi:MAG TPA: hypothetical protein VLG10_02670 [Methylomirabilota bacterium]|nr:hypothetical protein [Methylomirabilota bacterium]
MDGWLVVTSIALLAVCYVMIPAGVAARRHFRRQKLVRCPLIGLGAGVLIRRAGLAEAIGCRSLRRVADCTLWPRHKGCAQRCLDAPEEEIRDFRMPLV